MAGGRFFSVTKILQKSLRDLVVEDEPRVRPSTLGHCPRQVYFSIIRGIDPEVMDGIDGIIEGMQEKAIAIGFFASGRIHEELLKERMAEAGFHYQCYVQITPDLWGHCDFFKYDEEKEECYIVDIKTTSLKSVSYLPKQSHIVQVMLYLHGAMQGGVWLVDSEGNKVKNFPPARRGHGCIFYIIRENPAYIFDRQECWFEYDREAALSYLNFKKYLDDAIANKVEPPIPRDYSPFSYPCMYVSEFSQKNVACPYWKLCWKKIVEKKMGETEEGLRRLCEELINAYVEKERATARYTKLLEQLKMALEDVPYCSIYTNLGEVKKSTYTKRFVRYKELVGLLVQEGLVPAEEMERLTKAAESTDEITVVRVKPVASSLEGLIGEDSKEESEEVKP